MSANDDDTKRGTSDDRILIIYYESDEWLIGLGRRSNSSEKNEKNTTDVAVNTVLAALFDNMTRIYSN